MSKKGKSDKFENGDFKITQEPFYLPQGNEIAIFEAAHKNKLPVLLNGPTGSGKTRLVEHMAWRLNLPLIYGCLS